MALTLNLAVLPVVASLVAGTGALATYATTPSPDAPSAPQAAAVAPDTARPSPAPQAASSCDAQTWPYIDSSCTRKSAADRKVRVVDRAARERAAERRAPSVCTSRRRKIRT